MGLAWLTCSYFIIYFPGLVCVWMFSNHITCKSPNLSHTHSYVVLSAIYLFPHSVLNSGQSFIRRLTPLHQFMSRILSGVLSQTKLHTKNTKIIRYTALYYNFYYFTTVTPHKHALFPKKNNTHIRETV